MSLFPRSYGGYYDENGTWQRTKFCFVYCGAENCTCQPPFGIYQQPKPKEEQDGNNNQDRNGSDP